MLLLWFCKVLIDRFAMPLFFKFFKILKSNLSRINIAIRSLCGHLLFFGELGFNWEFAARNHLLASSSVNPVSVNAITMNSPFNSLRKSCNLSNFLFELLIFTWKIYRPDERRFCRIGSMRFLIIKIYIRVIAFIL